MASLQTWQQMETVRKKAFPVWGMLNYGVFSDLVKKGEVHKIGERDFRIPAVTELGGREGTYDPQMGDMGRGQPPQGLVMTGSYFPFRMNFETDSLSVKATQATGIKDPMQWMLAEGFRQFRLSKDKAWHANAGTAVLATATSHSAGSVSTYTLDTVFGAQCLRMGQYVTVYNNALTTVNSAGVAKINQRNTQTRQIVLSVLVSGAANDDKFCFEGVSGSSPVGFRGLGYWLSTASSGTTAGVNRANVSSIISKSVSASSGPLLAELPMVLYHRILDDRGEYANELVGLAASSIQGAVWKNVLAIQKVDLDGTQAQAIDRLPALKGKKSFMWGGVPHMVDVHANWQTVYYVIPRMWGRAQLDTEDFFRIPGSKQTIYHVGGGSGAPRAGSWFGLTCDEDLYTIDPGGQGLVNNIAVDSLYTS